jgi:hypothetical protein
MVDVSSVSAALASSPRSIYYCQRFGAVGRAFEGGQSHQVGG